MMKKTTKMQSTDAGIPGGWRLGDFSRRGAAAIFWIAVFVGLAFLLSVSCAKKNGPEPKAYARAASGGCLSDDDCDQAEYRRCLDGECAPWCNSEYDCVWPRICDGNECRDILCDEGCPVGTDCVDFKCVRNACDGEDDCPGGLVCGDNTCLQCADDDACGEGFQCSYGRCAPVR